MSLTPNCTNRDELDSDRALVLWLDHAGRFEPHTPECTACDWTSLPLRPKHEGFRFALAPLPILSLTGIKPFL
jgi:hypothetical protein